MTAPGTIADALDGARRILAAAGVPVATGRFGAHMMVELVNDGPVTIVLEMRNGRVV